MKISKKQENLKSDIVSENKQEIYVLGSVQSGKTFIIAMGLIEYAEALYKYDPNKLYYGAIIGWTIETLKGNIVEVLELHLNNLGLVKDKHYKFSWSSDDKYLQIYNIKFFFFGFNNVKSFNKILGKPLVLEWIDESAKIYSYKELHESFNQLIGRQVSFAGHPYIKMIHSFNVEGSDNHPYKIDYIDNKPNAIHYTFFVKDNPLLDTIDKVKSAVKMFKGALRKQKIFCQWVIAEGRVFTDINIIENMNYTIREIIIGIDYGSTNPTCFVPIALAFDKTKQQWKMVRLECYFHSSQMEGDNPTTEYHSLQLRMFLIYLKEKYPNIPVTEIVIDSEATHFHNRLIADKIPHRLAKKGHGSVNEGVEYMQSLFYKGYLEILKRPSIRYFTNDGRYELSAKDEGLLELESYRYDKIKSEVQGINVYKKELDHTIDAMRYALALMKELGLAPTV